MPNVQEMVRVLYRHDWTSVEEWASQFNQLANMTDNEVSKLVSEAGQQSPRSRAESLAICVETAIA